MARSRSVSQAPGRRNPSRAASRVAASRVASQTQAGESSRPAPIQPRNDRRSASRMPGAFDEVMDNEILNQQNLLLDQQGRRDDDDDDGDLLDRDSTGFNHEPEEEEPRGRPRRGQYTPMRSTPLGGRSRNPSPEDNRRHRDSLRVHRQRQGQGDNTVMLDGMNAVFQDLDDEKMERMREREEMTERMRRNELAFLQQQLDLQKQLREFRSGSYSALEKRTFVTLPVLKSEEDLEVWDSQLRASLAPYSLFKYLDRDVAEPEEDDKYKTWKADRSDIFKLIVASLKNGNIWSRMMRIGWKPDDVDPRAAYTKVFEALQHGTVHTTRLLIKEYMALKPKSYDNMDKYIDRLCTLRTRLRNMKIINPLEMDVYPVLTAIESDYPELFDRNIRKMDEKTLTWEDLVKDMTETCVDRDSKKGTFANIKIHEKGSNKKPDAAKDKDTSSTKLSAKQQKFGTIKCPDCDKYFKKTVRHCECGHHYDPRSVCWACNPEAAPDTWHRKAELIAQRATTQASTGPLHQNSGVANPATNPIRLTSLLQSTNFAMLAADQQHFR